MAADDSGGDANLAQLDSKASGSGNKKTKRTIFYSRCHRVYEVLSWTPPKCRWDLEKPPQFSLALNVLFAFAGAFTVANLYYSHPILNIIADDFHVPYERVSQIPTLMQAGYAIGLFFLCPLGDLLKRRPFVLSLVLFTATLWLVCPEIRSASAEIKQDRPLSHQVFGNIFCYIICSRDINSNASVDASSCRRSRPPSSARGSIINRCVRICPWNSDCKGALWDHCELHDLANDLLDGLRAAVSHLHPSLAIHARLSVEESGRLELLQNALEHLDHLGEEPCIGTSVLDLFLQLSDFHELLDNPDLSPCRAALPLLTFGNWAFRSHWDCVHVLWPDICKIGDRSLRTALFGHCWGSLLPRRDCHQYIHRNFHHCRANHPGFH